MSGFPCVAHWCSWGTRKAASATSLKGSHKASWRSTHHGCDLHTEKHKSLWLEMACGEPLPRMTSNVSWCSPKHLLISESPSRAGWISDIQPNSFRYYAAAVHSKVEVVWLREVRWSFFGGRCFLSSSHHWLWSPIHLTSRLSWILHFCNVSSAYIWSCKQGK